VISEWELAGISRIDGIFDMVLTEQVVCLQKHAYSRIAAAMRSANSTADALLNSLYTF
jgi:hypothetical protein